MTLIEAINLIDELKPNGYSQHIKVRWLSTLDLKIKTEIIDTHEGGTADSFEGYTEDIDNGTVLLVPAPYDEVYKYWLEAQIDYHNGEFAKYNNSMAMFNTAYSNYERYYNRTHMPKATKIKYF